MPLPVNPINPTEQYLNRIVTGEGELPPHPITREHRYLEAMAGILADIKSRLGSFVVASLPRDAAEGQIAISMSTGHPIPHLFLNGAWTSMLLFDKPVGYIYISASSEDPGELYGGTWARIAGRFLLGATDGGNSGAEQAAGNTGGLAAVTLDSSMIPAHTHGTETLTGYTHIKRHGDSGSGTTIVGSNSGIVSTASETWSGSHGVINAGNRAFSNPLWDKITVNATHEHDSVGGGQPHENMPPYLSVYMWQRTA